MVVSLSDDDSRRRHPRLEALLQVLLLHAVRVQAERLPPSGRVVLDVPPQQPPIVGPLRAQAPIVVEPQSQPVPRRDHANPGGHRAAHRQLVLVHPRSMRAPHHVRPGLRARERVRHPRRDRRPRLRREERPHLRRELGPVPLVLFHRRHRLPVHGVRVAQVLDLLLHDRTHLGWGVGEARLQLREEGLRLGHQRRHAPKDTPPRAADVTGLRRRAPSSRAWKGPRRRPSSRRSRRGAPSPSRALRRGTPSPPRR